MQFLLDWGLGLVIFGIDCNVSWYRRADILFMIMRGFCFLKD